MHSIAVNSKQQPCATQFLNNDDEAGAAVAPEETRLCMSMAKWPRAPVSRNSVRSCG